MRPRQRHSIMLAVTLCLCSVSWGQKASGPNPPDGATGVSTPLFSWTAGSTAMFHNLYLGKTSALGPADLVGSYQSETTFFHPGVLEPGTMYYWRVDEIEGDGVTIHTGDVWTFTTEALTAFTFQGGIPVQAGAPIGHNQAILVIYVRAIDDTTLDLQTLRTSEQAEFTDVSTFFRESSFNQISFSYTHAPNTGWYQLRRRYHEYMSTFSSILGLFTDSLQAVEDDGFSVGSFSQVVVVIIGPFYRGVSCAPTTFTLRNDQGEEFQVILPVVLVSTFTGWSRTAHEFGHAFCDFADLYEADSRRVDDWDIMDCGDCGAQTTGWHKDKKAGWFSGSQLKILVPPSGTDRVVDTTVLAPYEMENPPADTVQSLRLDVGAELHLYVENRQKIAGQTGSQELPANGVIITDATDEADQVIPIWPPFEPWVPVEPLIPIRLFGGPITAGNSFRDASYGGLTIEVDATGMTQYLQVTTQWRPNPVSDLSITRWSPPPWESRDIWIDSPVNGWDTYEYSDVAVNPAIPGNPVRNGDRPRVGRANRVYARVFNNGHLLASNVQVSFYVADPAAIGSPASWTTIPGPAVVPWIAPGEYSTVRVEWTPSSSSHACIIASIEVQPGEMNPDNNEAQENVTDFDTTSASPWKSVSPKLQVSNPTGTYQNVRLQMDNLPSGWTGWVSERLVPLAPGETKSVQYRIDPGQGGTMEIGSRADINIVGWVFVGDREVPLGGITSAVHLVQKSEVTITDLPGTVSLDTVGSFIVNVVVTPPVAGLPVALDISEAEGTAYSIANGVTDNQGQVTFNIGDLVRDGVVALDAGKTYVFRVDLYGSASVQANTSSDYTVVVLEPTLIAHWRLDETSGTIATDSAGANHGTVVGNPTWQPTGGALGGALQFDGGMRFVSTEFIYQPSAGPFSVFAWVKGGAPRQVILSQQGASNWLMADPGGNLMTQLKPSKATSLASHAVITDGRWHYVGLVWDGSDRVLYVDNVEVARDMQTRLQSSTGGLYIGAGATLTPGTFWSGLVDDVRIYNRAVSP